MSSPITFSGFNDIDFNVVLNALMTQASQPLTALQNRQKALNTQISSFDTLKSRVSSLRSAADSLGSMESISTMAGTSSNPGVSISTGNDAQAGHYDVVVNELARAQVTASTALAITPAAPVASGGSLTIGGIVVEVTGDVTLEQLAAAINATEDVGVNAAVVKTGPNSQRLALTSKQSGEANAFTIVNALTGGSGLQFGDDDGNGISGDSAIDNAVNASDASILINNIAATSTTNVFEDVVPGVTLTVSKKDTETVVGLDVGPDGTALESKVNAFITAYNDLVRFTETQRTSSGNGDAGSIGREPMMRQLRNSLRTELLGPHGAGTLTRLSEAGVEFGSDGFLTLNKTMFDEAVASNGDAVRELFAGTGGIFPAVETALEEYTQATGFISTIKERLKSQISAMDSQIEAMQRRLALQREAMQRQFTEADAAMSRLKNQSGSLASLGIGTP